ncbi:MAG TPA: Gfo/Idh/MocA family oxidoreductase [Candidatus Methylomirabilis sp.]|nr:Gfo/Idh/MocA family oxidoreductase [Candidatus Methylomirabilis sp.]
MINIGIVGYGYWGPNLVRNLAEISSFRIMTVSDLRQDRLDLVKSRYPTVKITTSYQELLDDESIDAIAIATPVSTHFDLGMQALHAGKHVFLEKPLTLTSEQAVQLIKEAERRKLVLMVDHTFVYTGAIRKIKEMIENNKIGDIYYYDSVRVNLGLFQHDVDVMWDLAVHDLSIMDYVLQSYPVEVSAIGMGHIPASTNNIAYLTLFFEGSLIAHVHVNWLAPVKLRQTLIGGSQKMIVYDDLEPSEKVKVYDKGITINKSIDNIHKALIGYRTGDLWVPQLDMTEALRVELLHFYHCIEKGEKPITDGEAGLRVVQILEAATQSMQNRGQLVKLNNKVNK